MTGLDRRSFLASALAAGVGFGAGCVGPPQSVAYRSYGYDSHNRGFSLRAQAPARPVEPVWEFTEVPGVQTPAVVDGTVFVASSRDRNSTVVALDAETGTERWEYDAGARLGSRWTPAVDDGRLFFVDTAGTAHAVDTDAGTRAWRRELPQRQGPSNAPIVTDGALVFGLGTQALLDFGGLYALDTTDGTVRWHKPPDETSTQGHTPAFPAASGGLIYYSTVTAPEVLAVSAESGAVEWQSEVPGEGGYSGVALTDDRLYLGGPGGQAAVRLEDRSIEWQFDGGFGPHPPTVADRTSVVDLVDGDDIGIRAVDAAGEELWRQTTDHHVEPSPRTVAGGLVYYAANGRLFARDIETGDLAVSFGPDPLVAWTSVVLDETIFVTSPGRVFALRSTS